MCGFAGILHFGACADAPARVRNMTTSIVHRGPDDEGFWHNDDVALGFRRLSIVDLEGGHQPMSNEDGSVWVVYNGEIYNHRALRSELEAKGHVFGSDHSDTEVLVHGYEEWGRTLPERLNGMFAFAVWDCHAQRITLALDRFGIKPLYISEKNSALVFGSEVRTLHASGLVESRPNSAGLLEYFLQQNNWGGRSVFADVELVRPGFLIEADRNGVRRTRYWDLAFNRRRSAEMRSAASDLRSALSESLSRQIEADVPVMSYLSGGIDSSSITAGAYHADKAIKAYSCIFDLTDVGEDKFVDEREFSREVARFLGIEHVELEIPRNDLVVSLFPTVRALEEPRMGMAYVNWRIAQRVAADSKVVLSGCGGDEILGGYVGRYAFLRIALASAPAVASPTDPLKRLKSFMAGMRKPAVRDIREPLLALFGFPVLKTEIEAAFTADFLREAGDYRVRDGLEEVLKDAPSDEPWDILMYVDAKTYLHGLLVIEDKLSMSHSLETRVPLLDNQVVDLALDCPWPLLNDGETGKMVFREAIRDWVPQKVADKPKMGFGPPDASWYRGALRPFIEDVLSTERVEARGIFDPGYVATALEQHMSGTANRLPLIWSLLSFEAWCEDQGYFGGDLGRPLQGK